MYYIFKYFFFKIKEQVPVRSCMEIKFESDSHHWGNISRMEKEEVNFVLKSLEAFLKKKKLFPETQQK